MGHQDAVCWNVSFFFSHLLRPSSSGVAAAEIRTCWAVRQPTHVLCDAFFFFFLGRCRGENAHFARAVGNIPKVDYIDESELNVYQMLLRHKLVLTRSAVDALFTRLVANEKVPTFLGSANDPAQDVAYVKPRYARDTRSKQSLRPSFLPSQSKKKPPKRVVRMYVSPRKGGRRYVDRKYAKVGGAIAKYSGRIGNKNVRASKEELEDDE
jgi:hypothetical protein